MWKTHFYYLNMFTVPWLSAVDKLFCLFVGSALEHKHYHPTLEMRKPHSLSVITCSSSHCYFVTQLGFKPVVYQSEPSVLSHLCHVGSSVQCVAPFGIKIGL